MVPNCRPLLINGINYETQNTITQFEQKMKLLLPIERTLSRAFELHSPSNYVYRKHDKKLLEAQSKAIKNLRDDTSSINKKTQKLEAKIKDYFKDNPSSKPRFDIDNYPDIKEQVKKIVADPDLTYGSSASNPTPGNSWGFFSKKFRNIFDEMLGGTQFKFSTVDPDQIHYETEEKTRQGSQTPLPQYRISTLKNINVTTAKTPILGIKIVSNDKHSGPSTELLTQEHAEINFSQTPKGGLLICVKYPQHTESKKSKNKDIVFKHFDDINEVEDIDIKRALRFFIKIDFEMAFHGNLSTSGKIWIAKVKLLDNTPPMELLKSIPMINRYIPKANSGAQFSNSDSDSDN